MDKKQQLLTLLKQKKEQKDLQSSKGLLDKFSQNVEQLKGKEGEKGDKGDKGEKGDRGDKGIDGKNGYDGKNGITGQKGLDGLDGKDGIDGEQGLPGYDGKNGLDGSPDSAFDIRNKLELLNGEERLDLTAVKGVDKLRNSLLELMQKGLMSLDKNKVLGIKSNGIQVGFANELNISGATISNNNNQGVDIAITPSSIGISTYTPITITGTVDGTNLNFTVASGVTVYELFNGTQFQTPGITYNQVGTAITFTSGNAPVVINGQPTLSLIAYGSIAAIPAFNPSTVSILLGWAYVQAFALISGTRDGNEALTSGTVQWPDGATGVFTATTLSTAFPGAIDAYTVTYVANGVTRTITQPLLTRDPAGAVTAQPALTIS